MDGFPHPRPLSHCFAGRGEPDKKIGALLPSSLPPPSPQRSEWEKGAGGMRDVFYTSGVFICQSVRCW